MNIISSFIRINSLPENLKQEVKDFIEFLFEKNKKNKQSQQRVFGVLKGKIKLNKGFDEPIDDFKDYM